MITLLKNATIINEGSSFSGALLIDSPFIKAVITNDAEIARYEAEADRVIDLGGLHILPGVIDDQVHFREPGGTHKATIESESAAAALGGVTSYMDMPNNTPPTCSLPLLEAKYERAAEVSYVNYSFYFGANNENIAEITSLDPKKVCGVKVFMGSSTGNMLVDNPIALDRIFSEAPLLVATHCEKEAIVRENTQKAQNLYGDNIPIEMHPQIRSEAACVESTKEALELALRHNTRLHVLHISTAKEVEMLEAAKRVSSAISGEICVHHLFFSDADYAKYGTLIKCNPAIKTAADRAALRAAVRSGAVSVVATDHAPHLLNEKQNNYIKAPSGIPLVQNSLQMMLELAKEGVFTLEEVVDRMSHSPARCFSVSRRGFIREGYFADLVVVDLNKPCKVHPASKCGWAPVQEFRSSIVHTFSNGVQIVKNGSLTGEKSANRLEFNR